MNGITLAAKPQPEAYAQRLVLAVLKAAHERGQLLSSRQIGELTATIPAVLKGKNGMSAEAFPISDPRKTISKLRRRGYEIADKWERNSRNVRYKVYWLIPGEEMCVDE